MKEVKTIYYSDELNDEFAGDQIKAKVIDKNYRYERNPFLHFFFYRMIATPLAYLYLKIKFHHKIINKKVLKPYKKEGYFMYGNHTNQIPDALIPTMITSPKDAYVIVHPNNVSMPFLGKINPYLGALPLPDDLSSSRNFIKCIENKLSKKKSIVIYPEAHIWPYYTKIRPFKDTSFHYPIKYKKPIFIFVNTYQQRKKKEKVNIVTYVDGPFFPDETLPLAEQKKKLRDEVYSKMVNLSKNSNYEVIHYQKKEQIDD